MKHAKGKRRLRGATVVEYAIAAALLVIVFIYIGKLLHESSDVRGKESLNAVASMAPCPSGILNSDECF